jgi:hypothetical protein
MATPTPQQTGNGEPLELNKMNNNENRSVANPSKVALIALLIKTLFSIGNATKAVKTAFKKKNTDKNGKTIVPNDGDAVGVNAVKAWLKTQGIDIDGFKWGQLLQASPLVTRLLNHMKMTDDATVGKIIQHRTIMTVLTALRRLQDLETLAESGITNTAFGVSAFDELLEMGLHPTQYGIKKGDFIRTVEAEAWQSAVTDKDTLQAIEPQIDAVPAYNCSSPKKMGCNDGGYKWMSTNPIKRNIGLHPSDPKWHVGRVQAGATQAKKVGYNCPKCNSPMYGKSLTYNMMRVVAQSTDNGYTGTAWKGIKTPVRIPVAGQAIIRNMKTGLMTLADGFEALQALHEEKKTIKARIDGTWQQGRIVPVCVDESTNGKTFIDIAFILEAHA